jgi:hypothetical protein
MTLATRLKNSALKLIFSRFGPSVTGLVATVTGFILGYIVSGTSAIGFHLDAAQQTTVSLIISQFLYWLIAELVNKYAGEYATALQEVLKQTTPNLATDRWIGPETVAAAAAAAQAAASNPSTGEVIPTGKPVAVTIKPRTKRKPVIPHNPKR